MCREDWTIQILHGIQPLCLITRFGDGIEQMQSYIRPVSEGLVGLRALMKSALPLLITTPASKGPVSEQVWGKPV